jgi:hypothetical protein
VIWYVAYGSNLDRERFHHYLQGGAAPGARRVLTGARDTSPPADERAVTLPGTMFFAWESPTWGGGISFVEVGGAENRTSTDTDVVLGRAYLLTDEQFSDVATQEMHREPDQAAPLDLAHVLEHRRHTYGPGRYETLHHLGDLEGHPMLTFTTADRDGLRLNEPRPAYLRLLARGLRETHGLSTDEFCDYLLGRPGIGSWTAEGVRDLLG